MTAETVTIDSRFRGPMQSGNGGVAAGLAATVLGAAAAATVRLRRPPPLERTLTVDWAGDGIRVLDAGTPVLEVTPGARPVNPPVDEAALEATFRRGSFPVRDRHVAPACFVCGHREDGLRLSPHNLDGTDLWSTVWVPDATIAGADGVAAHVIWGALDCPAGFAVVRTDLEELTFFPALATHSVEIRHPVPVGAPVGVFGWKVSEDDRRVNGASALIAEDGTVLATGWAEHGRLPLDFAEH